MKFVPDESLVAPLELKQRSLRKPGWYVRYAVADGAKCEWLDLNGAPIGVAVAFTDHPA